MFRRSVRFSVTYHTYHISNFTANMRILVVKLRIYDALLNILLSSNTIKIIVMIHFFSLPMTHTVVARVIIFSLYKTVEMSDYFHVWFVEIHTSVNDCMQSVATSGDSAMTVLTQWEFSIAVIDGDLYSFIMIIASRRSSLCNINVHFAFVSRFNRMCIDVCSIIVLRKDICIGC